MEENLNPKGKILVIGGLIQIVLAIAAHFLEIETSAEFGWKQTNFLILSIGIVGIGVKIL